jgi:hypothetical protein
LLRAPTPSRIKIVGQTYRSRHPYRDALHESLAYRRVCAKVKDRGRLKSKNCHRAHRGHRERNLTTDNVKATGFGFHFVLLGSSFPSSVISVPYVAQSTTSKTPATSRN